jgi:hypothetical protein
MTPAKVHAMTPELQAALDRAKDWWNTATPEQRAEMKRKQRESYIRAMTTPCPHGVLDFETCPECRDMAKTA